MRTEEHHWTLKPVWEQMMHCHEGEVCCISILLDQGVVIKGLDQGNLDPRSISLENNTNDSWNAA